VVIKKSRLKVIRLKAVRFKVKLDVVSSAGGG
jgi:hypothetical protein